MGRWLATEGAMCAPPSWWRVVSAARYLGVAPWELARQPTFWTDAAHEAMAAEAHAREVRNQ